MTHTALYKTRFTRLSAKRLGPACTVGNHIITIIRFAAGNAAGIGKNEKRRK
jgi:hypothetical protein